MPSPPSRILPRFLTALFLLVMVLATGPGVLLVNRPQQWGGIPIIYLWGILWYFVIVVMAFIAYIKLWKSTETTDSGEPE